MMSYVKRVSDKVARWKFISVASAKTMGGELFCSLCKEDLFCDETQSERERVAEAKQTAILRRFFTKSKWTGRFAFESTWRSFWRLPLMLNRNLVPFSQSLWSPLLLLSWRWCTLPLRLNLHLSYSVHRSTFISSLICSGFAGMVTWLRVNIRNLHCCDIEPAC